MKFGVLVFPGSNTDSYNAIQDTIAQPADQVWHTETDLSQYDCIVIPGGSSYGDYVRPGAISQYSPVMEAVKKAAAEGTFILGIGNGFQILTEAGLLPGTFLQNSSLKFRCEHVSLRVENHETPFTVDYEPGEIIRIPIAHGFGNYYCDEDTLAKLHSNRQIVFRYEEENPNGSVDQIAGIVNEQGNVVGMMPRPERAVHALLGSEDGKRIFTSILRTWREKHDAKTASE